MLEKKVLHVSIKPNGTKPILDPMCVSLIETVGKPNLNRGRTDLPKWNVYENEGNFVKALTTLVNIATKVNKVDSV